MPKLTPHEANVLLGVQRLIASFGACLLKLPADVVPAGFNLILKEIKHMSDTFETEMTKLRADVSAQSTVIASATEAFRGLTAQLLAAEAAAKNAGATDAQVAGVTTLRQQLEANTASLAAAIPANTDTGAAPVTPTPEPAPVTSSVQADAPAAVDPAILAANQAR